MGLTDAEKRFKFDRRLPARQVQDNPRSACRTYSPPTPLGPEVIVLRNLQGLSHAEVAVRLDRTESAVRMLWLRALKQLREQVMQRQ